MFNRKLKNENKKSKKQKIITSIVTVLSSVALFTTATYAWFALTNSPQVSQLTLKAGTSGSLQICNTQNGNFSDTITLDVPAQSCLKPITTLNGTQFYKPVYGPDGMVASIEPSALSGAELANVSNKTEANGGYVIQKTFYLRATTESSVSLSEVDVRLAAPHGNTQGTKITNADSSHAAEAVRISFTCNGRTVILEPNADAQVAGRTTQTALSGFANVSTMKQSSSNFMFAAAGSGAYTQVTSDELFRIPVNTAVPVTMTVWLEGADPDCINTIMGNLINAQIRFISTDLN